MPTNTFFSKTIFFLEIFLLKPIHLLCESATLIDTKAAISQLSPIKISDLVAFISVYPPINVFFPIFGFPLIHTKG